MDSSDVANGLVWYGVFVFSAVLHEAAHAWTSFRLGDATAREQITLDPTPHIRREPVGMIVVPLIIFMISKGSYTLGWASAPYNALWAQRFPKRAAIMALAGPLSNLAVVLITMLIIRVSVTMGVFTPPETVTSFADVTVAPGGGLAANVAFLLSILFALNLLLFVFNLLPVPPLDGSAILPLFLSERMARSYLGFIRSPMFAILGIVVAWQIFHDFFGPVFVLALRVLYLGV